MRISDWSSDVCSSDLLIGRLHRMKALCRLGIVLVRVWMVDLGQSAIGQLHVAESGLDHNPPHFPPPHIIPFAPTVAGAGPRTVTLLVLHSAVPPPLPPHAAPPPPPTPTKENDIKA